MPRDAHHSFRIQGCVGLLQPFRSLEDKQMKLPLTGSCQCRNVRFQCTAAPASIYACHCTECQRLSGSAFGTSMLVPRDAFSVTQGTPRSWVRTSESGRRVECVFCPDCGTRLVHLPEHSPAMAIMRPGALDDTSWIRLAGHIWTRSKQPWFEVPPGSVTYEQQPPDFSRLIEAYRAMAQG